MSAEHVRNLIPFVHITDARESRRTGHARAREMALADPDGWCLILAEID
jgi:hypothetical protein